MVCRAVQVGEGLVVVLGGLGGAMLWLTEAPAKRILSEKEEILFSAAAVAAVISICILESPMNTLVPLFLSFFLPLPITATCPGKIFPGFLYLACVIFLLWGFGVMAEAGCLLAAAMVWSICRPSPSIQA